MVLTIYFNYRLEKKNMKPIFFLHLDWPHTKCKQRLSEKLFYCFSGCCIQCFFLSFCYYEKKYLFRITPFVNWFILLDIQFSHFHRILLGNNYRNIQGFLWGLTGCLQTFPLFFSSVFFRSRLHMFSSNSVLKYNSDQKELFLLQQTS